MTKYKTAHLKICVALVVILWFSKTGEACFPSKYWISCLIDTCKLGGKCPGDPTAECKMEKTKCNGCKPTWYTKTGEKANCSVRQNLNLCPGGEPVVHCKVDSCKWPCAHPDFKGAACRQGYCGECKAEYFVKDAWVNCPVSTTGATGEMLPIDSVLSDSCLKVPCSIDICINKRCPKVPRAVCRPDGCNQCKPAWFLDNLPVDCATGEFITNKPGFEPIVPTSKSLTPWQRECSNDVPLVPCDMKVCEKKICRNFPNAQCRPDGCGECKDTWYVDNKLVDCLSDECPPKVPIVKCVDDPCKYFGHYCPAAECRASQCGKCEAKFFANGQEIDCAMPPKECPAGVKPRNCPWYTCPANICPSDRRLMCRIDPCGSKCEYEFIDIYNGEPLLCRVFDGDGRYLENTTTERNTGMDIGRPPMFRDLMSPQVSQFDRTETHQTDSFTNNFVGEAGFAPVNTANAGGKSGFVAQPVFVNPGPPVTDPDLLSLLRAFPHEMANIPSAMIQSAIKNHKADAVISSPPAPLDVMPLDQPVVDPSIPVFAVENQLSLVESIQKPHKQQPMKKAFSTFDNVIDNQLLDLAPKDPSLYQEMLSGSEGMLPDASFLSQQEGIVNQPPIEKQKVNKPVYPELTNLAPKAIPAGKPLNRNSEILGNRQNTRGTADKTAKTESKGSGTKVNQPKKQTGGVPISLGIFSQWAMG